MQQFQGKNNTFISKTDTYPSIMSRKQLWQAQRVAETLNWSGEMCWQKLNNSEFCKKISDILTM